MCRDGKGLRAFPKSRARETGFLKVATIDEIMDLIAPIACSYGAERVVARMQTEMRS